MKITKKLIAVIIILMMVLSGCAYTTTVRQPDGTEVTETVVLEPWVGPGTPWVYYNDTWFYWGVPYVYYGGWGWAPWGKYNTTIIYDNRWYGSQWKHWYHKNPHHYKEFHSRYPHHRNFDRRSFKGTTYGAGGFTGGTSGSTIQRRTAPTTGSMPKITAPTRTKTPPTQQKKSGGTYKQKK